MSGGQEKIWRSIIPVESHTASPVIMESAADVAEAKLCWGAASVFEYSQKTEASKKQDAGGFGSGATVIEDTIHVYTTKKINWPIVWSGWEIRRVINPDNTDEFFDVKVYTEMIVKRSSESYKMVDGFKTNGETLFKIVTMETFLHFQLPPVEGLNDSQFRKKGTHGEKPDKPESPPEKTVSPDDMNRLGLINSGPQVWRAEDQMTTPYQGSGIWIYPGG